MGAYAKFLAPPKQRYRVKKKLPMWLIELLKVKEEKQKARERRIAEIERLLAGVKEKAPCGVGEFAQRMYYASKMPAGDVAVKMSRRERRAVQYA